MLTVILATRNGALTLPTVLQSYLGIQEPEGGWKLIVVDNASTDQTLDIVCSYQNRLPLSILREGKPGKNAALNAALTHIEGDLVVLTDDDAVPRADWLVAMRTAADAHPAYSIFGGGVTPRWEISPPGWILNSVPLGPVFTVTPSSLGEGPIDPGQIYGPNMAVRAEVFARGFRFDPTIGPQGASYAMGSETEFVKRLATHGYLTWFVPDAEVEHIIREFQMRRPWVLRRAIRFGRGLYRVNRTEEAAPAPTWLGVPRYMFREMARQSALIAKGFLTFRDDVSFRARWEMNVVRGQAIEALADHASRRLPPLTTSAVGSE